MPDPNAWNYTDTVVEAAWPAVKAAKGGAFFLCTSLRAMRRTHELLKAKIEDEGLDIPLLVQGASTTEIRRKVAEALRSVGLDHKKDLFPPGLSTGEQQRVCIARAIVNGPIMLLADEPTGNLDPELTSEIIELFKAINARGTTIIVATHDPNVLAQVNRRVITLEHGKVVSREQVCL
mgnify:CR=1 FL=1